MKRRKQEEKQRRKERWTAFQASETRRNKLSQTTFDIEKKRRKK
jgi:hypothetical protein